MDVPLLRTMTKKSVLNFGKYSDLSVGQVIVLNHTRYLRWCYYNLSKISFTDEILEEIGLDISTDKIEKPGVNKELGESIDRYYDKVIKSNEVGISGHIHRLTKAKANRGKLNRINREDRFSRKKSILQSKNHGH